MIAALSAWHERHDAAARALEPVSALPAHALLEVYAVLTRLPSGLAVAPELAARTLTSRFRDPPLRLSDRGALVSDLAARGVFGGASYDALVALEAAEHGHTLLTLDDRAVTIYRRLGVAFTAINAR